MKNWFGFSTRYSLRKSREVLHKAYHYFKRKRKKLNAEQRKEIEETLIALHHEIEQKNRENADKLARHVQFLLHRDLKKNLFDHIRDLVFGLGFALFIAVLVRTMWFEPYEIPTGSMRPTFKEKDRLVVSKTDFGINFPLKAEHIYFDPDAVKRSGIFIFTTENMNVRDADTLYFYLFPGKKQFVKRMMGKPGDTLYFYGGLVYGIDADGNDISKEFQLPELERIDHIPFIHFEGNVLTSETSQAGISSPVFLMQMNEPIAKLSLNRGMQAQGEVLNSSISDYQDVWGFKNFAFAKLLDSKVLELKHSPSLSSLKLGQDRYGKLRPMLNLTTSHIPLKEEHLRTLFNNLYTARFVVKNGIAHRYGSVEIPSYNPILSDVADGTYEFYYGKAYEIKWEGIAFELPLDHPLYRYDFKRLQLFFNLGIEMDTRFVMYPDLYPSRYAYFRFGDLYLLGAPILKKEDPILISYRMQEQGKALPFIDHGPPLTADGALDKTFIRKFGLKIPPKMYLALGDNYAMSSDSRDFGFVPEDNIRGAPDFIFWPLGSRFGKPNQPPYPLLNPSRITIWITAAICIGIWILWHRKRKKAPLNFN